MKRDNLDVKVIEEMKQVLKSALHTEKQKDLARKILKYYHLPLDK